MNKYIAIGAIVATATGFGLLYLFSDEIRESSIDAEATAARAAAQLLEQNGSGMHGMASFVETDEGVRVVLNLVGAPEDTAQPAHVHFNSCSNIGEVKYPLTFPVNGYSETLLDISMADIRNGLPLSVNVHQSPEELEISVACGRIIML